MCRIYRLPIEGAGANDAIMAMDVSRERTVFRYHLGMDQGISGDIATWRRT